MDKQYTKLTPEQKLAAMAVRFYQGVAWAPKAGDYYTTSRNDCELYRIAKIENDVVYTEYCTAPGELSEWQGVNAFVNEGFGPCRVWVPEYVLESEFFV